jgi:transcriptional regulator with XRE-family HTH domain
MRAFEEPTSFGPLLAKLRRQKELRQQDLADRLGCKRTFVSQMEREVKGAPTLPLLSRLAAAMELNEQEASALFEAAELTNRVVRLPEKMPLSVRQEFIRLARCEGSPSSRSWAMLKEKLALLAPAV